MLFTISDVEIQECPVSYIRNESIEVLQHYFRARRMNKTHGVSWFGPDLSEWPTWAVYAASALDAEQDKVDAAQFEAERER